MRECFIYTNHKYIANRLSKFINEGVQTNKHSSKDMDLIMQILHEINKIQQKNIKINIQSIQKPKSKTKKQQQTPQIVHPHFKLQELASEYAIKANTLPIIPTLTQEFYPNSTIQPLQNKISVNANIYWRAMVSYMELQFNSYIKDRFVWDQYIIDSI